MIEKLKSRKLWAAVVGSVVLTMGEKLGISPESSKWIAGLLASYVLGQGIADAGAGKSQTTKP